MTCSAFIPFEELAVTSNRYKQNNSRANWKVKPEDLVKGGKKVGHSEKKKEPSMASKPLARKLRQMVG